MLAASGHVQGVQEARLKRQELANAHRQIVYIQSSIRMYLARRQFKRLKAATMYDATPTERDTDSTVHFFMHGQWMCCNTVLQCAGLPAQLACTACAMQDDSKGCSKILAHAVPEEETLSCQIDHSVPEIHATPVQH
jgi:hypothetical protein